MRAIRYGGDNTHKVSRRWCGRNPLCVQLDMELTWIFQGNDFFSRNPLCVQLDMESPIWDSGGNGYRGRNPLCVQLDMETYESNPYPARRKAVAIRYACN